MSGSSPSNTVLKFLFLFFLGTSILSCQFWKAPGLMSNTTTASEPFYQEIKMIRSLGLIVVEVEIAGEKYRFLWDTGAICVISPELQKRHRLKTVMSSKIRDSGGHTKMLKYVQLPALKIGETEFYKIGSVVADLHRSTLLSCMNLDGIIGGNLMKTAFWKMDLKHNQLILTNQWDKFNVSNDAVKIPFDVKNNGTPYVNLYSQSKNIGLVNFDSGYSGFLSIAEEKLEKDSLSTDSTYTLVGFNSSGLYGSSITSVDQQVLEIGVDSNLMYQGVAKIYKNKKALLGVDFMENYKISLNWDKQSMWLEKQESDSAKELTFRTITPRYMNNKLIVGSLYSSSLTKDLLPGDTIETLNYVDVRSISNSEFCEMVEEIKHWPDTVMLEVRGKGEFNSVKMKISK